MLASIASNKWSGLVSRVPTKPSVVNPQKVNEAWNYSHFCVMTSLQPLWRRHLLWYELQRNHSNENKLWLGSRGKQEEVRLGAKAWWSARVTIFNMISLFCKTLPSYSNLAERTLVSFCCVLLSSLIHVKKKKVTCS